MQLLRGLTLSEWLGDELLLPRADIIALILGCSTGIVDVCTYQAVRAFAGNMTGNVVLLALAASGEDTSTLDPVRSIVSLSTFFAGAFLTGRAGKYFGARRRAYLLAQNLLQALFVLVGAILLWTDSIDFTKDTSSLGWLTVLAFTYGMQAAACRPMNVATITTVVITSCMVDLAADPALFTLVNVARNQRAAFLVTFFVSGIVGGVAIRHVNIAFALLLAFLLKLLASSAFLFATGKAEAARIEAARSPSVQGINA